MAEEEKKQQPESENEEAKHGDNWVTHLYDKANVSVKNLENAAIVLIILFFVLIFAFMKK